MITSLVTALRKKARRITSFRYSLILIFSSLAILLGILTVGNFGVSWDEQDDVEYGVESLKAYFSTPDWEVTHPKGPTGPFYFMISELSANIFPKIYPRWSEVDARHFTYYLSFLLSAISLYFICSNFVNKHSSFIVMVLFFTQPLLFGHAFINPKDIPFMGFFLATIASGLAMADSFSRRQSQNRKNLFLRFTPSNYKKSKNLIVEEFRKLNMVHKWLFAVLLPITVLMTMDLLILHRVTLKRLLTLVHNAYIGRSIGLIQYLFSRTAQYADNIDIMNYLWKSMRVYWSLRIPASIVLQIPLVIVAGKSFPGTVRLIFGPRYKKLLILSAFLLGFCISIRIIAPFAGLLVSMYFIHKNGLKSIWDLSIYWALAGIVCFVTRPYFWDDSIIRIWNSLIRSGDFGGDIKIFYNSETYKLDAVPGSYSPIILLDQLTEPLIILFIMGLLLSMWRVWKGNIDKLNLIVLVLWLTIPLTVVMLSKVQPYDNFRQLLFLSPVLFIFSSIAVQAIMQFIKPCLVRSIVVIAFMFPGIFGIFELHPYEYIYYNSLIGGLRKTTGELDYWCTSYRAAMLFLNDVAPYSAHIQIWGPYNNARPYARDDLRLKDLPSHGGVDVDSDLIVLCARFGMEHRFPDLEVIWKEERSGRTLTVVKQNRGKQ
jgi:hypothetical protein